MKPSASTPCVAFCTCPDTKVAEHLAGLLVEGRMAACVNVLDGVSSVYLWQGALVKDAECLLVIKTRRDRLAAIESLLEVHHPYELPELIAVAIESGSQRYLDWVDDCVTGR